MNKTKLRFNKNFLIITTVVVFFSLLFAFSFIILSGYNQFSDSNSVNSILPTPVYVKGNKDTAQDQTKSQISVPEVSDDKKTIEISGKPLQIAGWIPTWASPAGLQSLQKNPNYFNTISPVWYEVRADGTLNSKYPTNKTTLISYARSNNLKIIPTIGMFDHNLFGGILRSKQSRDRHIDSVVSTVISNGYDGIDLDYESISLVDKDLYFEFLDKLSTQLRANDKTLTVTVLAKWGDDVYYAYRPETRQVQDWMAIAQYADEIRIMAYDYTYSGDMYPGPIGPTGWIRKILEYAKGQIPPEKTVLGVHLYAYEWYQPTITDQASEKLNIQTNSTLNKQSNPRPAKAYTYSNVASILANNQGESSTFEGEKIFFYSAVNKNTGVKEDRALVYIDPDGVKARTDIAKEYGLKGVVFWRLGGEGSFLD